MTEPTVVRRLYTKAPIVEAVIDLRVTLAEPATCLAEVQALAERLNARFPQKHPVDVLSLAAQTKDGHLSVDHTGQERVGWKLIGANNDRMLLLGKDGFTYSHLPPYTNWETFEADARPLWSDYVGACHPVVVNRIGVRYINRLKLPPGEINLSDYLTFFPSVPDAVGSVAGIVLRIQVAEPNLPGNARTVITLVSESGSRGAADWQPMVLDFDISADVEMLPNEDGIWLILERMRNRKNELFEACLTDPMKELIQ